MDTQRAAAMGAVRGVCREMIDGTTTPYDGAKRIWEITLAVHPERFPEIDTFVYGASEWDERPEDAPIFAEGVMAAARAILDDGSSP